MHSRRREMHVLQQHGLAIRDVHLLWPGLSSEHPSSNTGSAPRDAEIPPWGRERTNPRSEYARYSGQIQPTLYTHSGGSSGLWRDSLGTRQVKAVFWRAWNPRQRSFRDSTTCRFDSSDMAIMDHHWTCVPAILPLLACLSQFSWGRIW